jgi:Cu+-exporting ATPase
MHPDHGPGQEQTDTTLLFVSGMTCNNCARHVSEAIQGVAGVRAAGVDLESQQAKVRWSSVGSRDVPALLRALEKAGYPSKEVVTEDAGEGKKRVSGWMLNLLLGIPVTLVLMAGEWALGLAMTPWFQWLAFGLATVVQVLAGARFYKGAWFQLKAGSSNMDTLVALGSTTAYAFSVWVMLSGHGGHVYFMESAAIITLISLGHWFESRMALKASSALRKLLDLAPAMARVVDDSGAIREVAVAELKPGDRFELRAGDKTPTDGVVLEGVSAADESMLTGESLPVDKAAGSEVYGGTVNLNGRLVARVKAVGEQTALAQIVAAVQRAQSSRADIQRLGDRVSGIFVPIVIGIALLAALWWGLAPESAQSVHASLSKILWKTHLPFGTLALPFIITASVLIIACPCAMGLATPAAIMAGSNAAAQRGILVRDGVALEKAGRVTAVLFDKTGTLTQGRPRLEGSWASDPAARQRIEASAGQLARHSTHPVSQAISKGQPGMERLSRLEEIRGAGIQARTDAATLRLGSLRWLGEMGVDTAPGLVFVNEWTSRGATVVGYSQGATLEGLFAVRDAIKPAAGDVVRHLSAQGLRVYMVTGDNTRTAHAIAAECGIDPENVSAEVRPEEKARIIKGLQERGEKVAFVGDGINDAPGLEQADLGIAVSRASDIAREAADIILLKSEIEAVPESIALARATLRTIKQNLFWAFFYNALGVPLAALGFMSPILCALAMGVSDVVVIGNALRLRRFRWQKG